VGDLIKLKFGKQDTVADFGKWVEGESAKDYVKPFLGSAVAPTTESTTENTTTTDPANGDNGAGVERQITTTTDPANKGNPSTPAPGNEFDPMYVRNMSTDEFKANADNIVKSLWPGASQ